MDQSFLGVLDYQMHPYVGRIVEDVRVDADDARALATTIAREIADATDMQLIEKIRKSSPLSVTKRCDFFESFQMWDGVVMRTMECPISDGFPAELQQNAYNEMLSVIPLYVSFVFVGDGLFEVLTKGPKGSCVRKCAEFIRSKSRRALRNALAHGNWHLTHTGSVKYWAQNGQNDETLIEHEASKCDMDFYMNLTRCVAWTSLLAAKE